MNEGVLKRSVDEQSGAHSGLSGNLLLKAAIFATGMSGIVAEYVMSTLASYLLGNEVVQWALTISIMLFAMGLGSRISKHFESSLLDVFIATELALSLLCAVSAASVYFLSIYIEWIALLIYSIALVIGLLIGMELPLAARLNDYFEELRVNVSSILEKDYYGALLGGLIFAFIALPVFGLTYTPIILGAVNLLVAAALYWHHRSVLDYRHILGPLFLAVPLFLGILAWQAEPIVLYAEQQKYIDRVIYQEQSAYQRIVMTRWKADYWLYLNGNQQFSSYDEERYHEPLVHPAMMISVARSNILILGGGDGLALREVLKYPEVETVTMVDLDPAMTRLGKEHPLLRKLNQDAMQDPRLQVINTDAYVFLKESGTFYDVIIVDLPDPKTVSLARLYSREFYQLAARHLSSGGTIVTQATSPFFSPESFASILKTVTAAGIPAVAYHTHIPTMGQWGWVLGMRSDRTSAEAIHKRLQASDFDTIDTRFLNRGAMMAMFQFGKNDTPDTLSVKVNQELDLSIYNYYRNGNWELY